MSAIAQLDLQRAVRDVAAQPAHILCVGGEDHALRIPFLTALRALGFDVSVAASSDEAPFAKAGIAFAKTDLARFVDPVADRAYSKSVRDIVGRLRPTIVQCFDTKPNILVPLALRDAPGTKVVTTINGLGWLYSSRSPAALALRPVFCALQRQAARWTDVMAFQNRDDLRFFQNKGLVLDGTSCLIPGSGIDLTLHERAATNGPSQEALRRDLGLSAGSVVVTVSRMTREKGIPTLLSAAKRVHRLRPDVTFLLIGPVEGEGRSGVTMADITQHEPYVRALGLRKDIPALLRLADIFVCPTELREGVPRVLLEAAASALPIVATAVPGCVDVIEDGVSGYLVPPRSPVRLAERILDLLADGNVSSAFGVRAKAHVQDQFGLDITLRRYAAVYRHLARCGAGRPAADDMGVPIVDENADETRLPARNGRTNVRLS